MLMVTACIKPKSNIHPVYTCVMHPDVISGQPGICPVCGMELIKSDVDTPVKRDSVPMASNGNVISAINTINPSTAIDPVGINANGIVIYDPRYINTIAATSSGRLEKVYMKYNSQNVKKGQQIADIYSPELITAQRELLYVSENDSNNIERFDNVKTKLLRFGLTQKQLAYLIETKHVFTSLPIYSSHEGYVIADKQTLTPITAMSDLDAGSDKTLAESSSKTSPNKMLREGDYVVTGQTLFTIAKPSALRIEINLQAAHTDQIHLHDSVKIQLRDGVVEYSVVDFIEPFLISGENFSKLHVYLKRNQDLKIGEIIPCTIYPQQKDNLWLPRAAIVDLGLHTVVFTRHGNGFIPKPVITGIHAHGQIQITEGILQTDEIAANAQYMVDSESFITIK
jgi:Cu(I)/Ag(I) efflux system membrane fusion protein